MFIEILRYLIYSKDTCADSMTFIYPIYFSYKNNSTHFAIEKYNSENPEIFNHTAKKHVRENPNEKIQSLQIYIFVSVSCQVESMRNVTETDFNNNKCVYSL